MHKHATVSAWRRAEDGSYESELEGCHLRVRWSPERPDHRRGFSWEATLPTGVILRSRHVEEEIEIAMALVESAAMGEPIETQTDKV